MRLLVVRHHVEDHAGSVGEAFSAHGAHVTTRRYPAEPLPEPEGYDHVVVLGASWSVNDEGELGRKVAAELSWLRRIEERGQPLIGICFGAQLLAAAGGGRVERAPSPEIGWRTVETAPGVSPAIGEGPWFQFHFDRFLVSAGDFVLARSPVGVQAFVRGRSLGVQFHPEIDAEQLSGWLDETTRGELIRHGVDPGQLLADTAAAEEEAALRARELVDSYLEWSR